MTIKGAPVFAMPPYPNTDSETEGVELQLVEFTGDLRQGLHAGAQRVRDGFGNALTFEPTRIRSEFATLLDTAKLVWSRQLQRCQELAIVKKLTETPIVNTAPVVMVGLIMGTINISVGWFMMPSAHVASTSAFSLAFHACTGMALVSYVQAASTDPGEVPDDWAGQPGGLPRFAQGDAGIVFAPVERKKNGEYRYCKREKKFKPDRGHFCRQLKRNVLRMDHYCPWLLNCVGHKNHKYFLLFLLYTTVSVNLSGCGFVHVLWTQGPFTAMNTFMMHQGTALSFLISIIVTPFTCWHGWLLKNNMTTIEFCEQRGRDGNYRSRYDVGLFRNLRSVFGEHLYLWPLPIGGPPGDGLAWEKPEDVADLASPENTGDHNRQDVTTEHRPLIPVAGIAAAFSELGSDCVETARDIYNSPMWSRWRSNCASLFASRPEGTARPGPSVDQRREASQSRRRSRRRAPPPMMSTVPRGDGVSAVA